MNMGAPMRGGGGGGGRGRGGFFKNVGRGMFGGKATKSKMTSLL